MVPSGAMKSVTSIPPLTPASAAAAHLPALACLSRRLREPGVAERLRSTRDQVGLYATFAGLPARP